MGGLAHFLEEEGVPTTLISLVREHTEIMRPPRALWVPFEFGRPIGAPNNPEFQSRVVMAALTLFEAENGPILEDFPEDAPVHGDQTEAWACPISFPGIDDDASDQEKLAEAFKNEINQLRSWYDLGLKKRGRSTVGVSGIALDDLAGFISSFLNDEPPENLNPELSLPEALNLATDDLKAFYTEAVTAQPGQISATGDELSDWFWNETAAARLLFAVREVCSESENRLLKIVGSALIVPSEQIRRKWQGN